MLKLDDLEGRRFHFFCVLSSLLFHVDGRMNAKSNERSRALSIPIFIACIKWSSIIRANQGYNKKKHSRRCTCIFLIGREDNRKARYQNIMKKNKK